MMFMKNSRMFDIVTLSDNNKGQVFMKNNLNDVVTILTSAAGLLSQIFPNLFGGGKKKLNDSDWLTIIPGAGYWTTELRNYLKTKIQNDTALSRVQEYTRYFVDEQRSNIDSNLPPYPAYISSEKFNQVYTKFLSILEQEKLTGGTSPVGLVPGGMGSTFNIQALAPLLIGGIALVALMKSKKRKRG